MFVAHKTGNVVDVEHRIGTGFGKEFGFVGGFVTLYEIDGLHSPNEDLFGFFEEIVKFLGLEVKVETF